MRCENTDSILSRFINMIAYDSQPMGCFTSFCADWLSSSCEAERSERAKVK